MNKDKYYTPEISDIRIGYECEVNIVYKEPFIDTCIPVKFKAVDEAVINYHSKNLYRTPFLTKEQIIAEGWKANNTGGLETGFINGVFGCTKGNYMMGVRFNRDIPVLDIMFRDPFIVEWVNSPEHFRCVLKCPSINEFRMIFKLL